MRNIEAEADARRAIVREARDRRIAERIDWPDDTTPRTDRPVRFVKQSIADGEYPIIVH